MTLPVVGAPSLNYKARLATARLGEARLAPTRRREAKLAPARLGNKSEPKPKVKGPEIFFLQRYSQPFTRKNV